MQKQRLLLHCCCAPCASSVVERLLKENKYEITMYFSNSNILPQEEYEKRKAEMIRLNQEIFTDTKLIIEEYCPNDYFDAIKGLESLGEGSVRCDACIGYRMKNTARYAKENHFDLFATTLTVSPHKNAKKINEIGESLSQEFDVEYMPSDFKKQNGFLRSIELCKEYDIYRQKYCGCGLDLWSLKQKEI